MPIGATEVFAFKKCGRRPFAIDQLDFDDTIGQPKRRLQGVNEASGNIIANDQPINDNVDVVLLCLGQLGGF